MTVTVDTMRLVLGLDSTVISDEAVEQAVALAQDWCDVRASSYSVTAPDSAVVDMAIYYLRQHLDLAGIKPSSITMPDLSMSTDVRTMCELAKDNAVEAIKAAAYAKGAGIKHIRSGKVGRWH